jgi:hypothetical protein
LKLKKRHNKKPGRNAGLLSYDVQQYTFCDVSADGLNSSFWPDFLRFVCFEKVIERKANGIGFVVGKRHSFYDVALRVAL